jgi:hypothetical protein
MATTKNQKLLAKKNTRNEIIYEAKENTIDFFLPTESATMPDGISRMLTAISRIEYKIPIRKKSNPACRKNNMKNGSKNL